MNRSKLTGRLSSLFAAAALLLGLPAQAATSACQNPSSMPGPKIGLVLGGGGARGAAHIGVIRRLEELRVPVHYVAGTSMGSLVGGFYATGMTAAELEHTVSSIDFQTLFKDATPRKDQSFRRKRDDNLALFGPKLGVGPNSELLPTGAVYGQQISYLFESLTSARTRERDFDRLPISYRAVAADIETGEPVVLAEGSLSLAMRSSMSVPGAFAPVEWGDHLLVDGGIANNLPVNVARELGADMIIAVEVGTPPANRENLRNMAAFVGQLSNLMIANNTRLQVASLGADDLLLRPELGSDITSAGFDKVSEAIVIGYAAADAASEQLVRYSVSEEDYARYRALIASCVQGPATIDFVKVDNRSRFSDNVIDKRLDIEPGSTIDNEQLKAAVDRVFALGFLSLVRHEIVQEEDGSTGALLRVDQDTRGANFLEWGLDLISDGDDAELDLRVGYLKTDLDEYGSELRLLAQVGDTPALMADLYKALGPELKWFVQPRLYAEWRDITIYNEREHSEAVLNIDQWGANLAIQREFGNRSSLWGGVRLYDGTVTADVGNVPSGVGSYKGGEYAVGYDYDTADNRYYPSSGLYASAEYATSDDSLGADDLYDQSVLVGLAAHTWGRHTLIGNLRYSTTLSGTAPYWARFRAGGLFALSGLQPDQISGDHFGFGMASWRYAMNGSGFFPAHAGVSLEYGNAADQREDIIDEGIAAGSVYLGYRSPLGPLYWGVGFAEGGQRAYFLRLGNIFARSNVAR